MGKNKIIAISGEPVTGKGTTVEALKQNFEEQGYIVHVVSAGHEFRKYFNAIAEFIRNYKDIEKAKELSKDTYLKELFEIKEYREVLINTISELEKNNIDSSNLTIEQANNLKEFSDLRRIVDTIIDEGIRKLGEEINSEERPNEVWLVDSRLAFHNIPEALSVRLVSTPEVAAQRLFNDQNRGKEDNKYENVQEAFESREKRRIGEEERYLKRYGVKLGDEDNYDLIIDTSYSSIDDISDTILKCLDCYTKGKTFAKKWTSPKTLLPMQTERTTLRDGESRYNFEELAELIKQNGYLADSPVEIIEVDGYKYLINGHHRNFAAAYTNKTLVPYEVIAKDDERLPIEYRGNENETARDRAKTKRSEYLYGHEWFIGEDFSYEEVYPGIYNKLKEMEEEQR